MHNIILIHHVLKTMRKAGLNHNDDVVPTVFLPKPVRHVLIWQAASIPHKSEQARSRGHADTCGIGLRLTLLGLQNGLDCLDLLGA